MGAKQQVELDDEDGAAHPAASPPGSAEVGAQDRPTGGRPAAPGRRRPTRGRVAVLLAAGLVVLGLVGAQVVLDARERSRIADLAGLPGVVADLTRPPALDPAAVQRPAESSERRTVVDASGQAPGAVVRSSDGEITLDGVAENGELVWSVPLRELDPSEEPGVPAEAGTAMPFEPACWAGPGPQPTVVCLTGDGAYRSDGTTDGRTWARLVEVALLDGTVVREQETDPAHSRFLSAAGDVLVVSGTDGAEVVVTAYGTVDWDDRWTRRIAVPDVGVEAAGVVLSTSSFVVVSDGTGLVVLSAADGSVLLDVDDTYLSGLVMNPAQDEIEMLALASPPTGAGGAPVVLWSTDATVEVDGDVLGVVLDDGSLGDVVLTTDGTDVAAWDRDGDLRWRSPDVTGWSVVVLDGRALVMGDTSMLAVDGGSGELLWEVRSSASTSFAATDGRVVATCESSGSGTSCVLVAHDLATGDEVWRTTLDDVQGVGVRDGELVGSRADGSVVALG